MEARIAAAETRIFKAVFPSTTNHYDTLFGGTALQLMDEVAFIAATRFSRKRMVTVSSDKINFTKSIPAGTIIELVGRVEHVGNTSIRIAVEIYVEEMYSMERQKAIHGSFTFVALDEDKKPIRIV
ncbi:acyl-CoA thioesterase [Spirosoma sp. HMF4905]|uniref:Acyl-CoA thioesterase n=1 Tax=Spirosoma arboris TaxID=2682092 RepID=A0A7K1SAH3_9BACT|nr:acyl-CoA thioesterase [Spirosoma arboris]